MNCRNLRSTCIYILLLACCLAPIASAEVPSPEDFFGFQMGTDKKIARWDKIIEYFELLEKESDKIKVVDMGPSTDGPSFSRGLHLLGQEHGQPGPICRRSTKSLATPRG